MAQQQPTQSPEEPDASGGQDEGSGSRDAEEVGRAIVDTLDMGQRAAWGLAHKVLKAGRQSIRNNPDLEVRLGRRMDEQALQGSKLIRPEPVATTLEGWIRELMAKSSRHDLPGCTLRIIDSPEVNACTLPGGYLHVYRGLLDLGLSDAALQFVVAHEISHLDLRHHILTLLANETFGSLSPDASMAATVGATLLQKGFSQSDEFDADHRAVQLLIAAGFPVRGYRSLFARLEEAQSAAKASVEPSAVATGPAPSRIILENLDRFLRTHPPSRDRLARLDESYPDR